MKITHHLKPGSSEHSGRVQYHWRASRVQYHWRASGPPSSVTIETSYPLQGSNARLRLADNLEEVASALREWKDDAAPIFGTNRGETVLLAWVAQQLQVRDIVKLHERKQPDLLLLLITPEVVAVELRSGRSALVPVSTEDLFKAANVNGYQPEMSLSSLTELGLQWLRLVNVDPKRWLHEGAHELLLADLTEIPATTITAADP